MKFGTFITSARPERIAANVRQAEEYGIESVWIAEHLIIPTRSESKYPYSSDGRVTIGPDQPFHDPMQVLAFAAALTSRVKLATGIFVVPLRNPFATARAVASLDMLSGGRFIFGVGIGWWAEEFEVVGANFKERALRTREYLELMKVLWTQSDPIYEGKTVSVKDVKFNPKTIQQPHPPIVFGGTTEPSLKRAARLGDGWYGIADSLAQVRGQIQRLREYETRYQRAQPLELTVNLRTGNPLSLDEVKTLAEMGVDRTLIGSSLRPLAADELVRLRDEVMLRLA